jgi:chromosome segregation ATPase
MTTDEKLTYETRIADLERQVADLQRRLDAQTHKRVAAEQTARERAMENHGLREHIARIATHAAQLEAYIEQNRNAPFVAGVIGALGGVAIAAASQRKR